MCPHKLTRMHANKIEPKPPCDEETVAKLTICSFSRQFSTPLLQTFCSKLSTEPKNLSQNFLSSQKFPTQNFSSNQKFSTKPKIMHHCYHHTVHWNADYVQRLFDFQNQRVGTIYVTGSQGETCNSMLTFSFQ